MNINPVVAIISGMLALITTIWAVVKNWDAVVKWLKETKDWLIKFWEEDLKPIMKSIGDFLSFGETRDIRFSKQIELNQSSKLNPSRIPEIPREALQYGNKSSSQTFNLDQKINISVSGEDAPLQTVTRLKNEIKAGFKSSAFSYVDPLSF
jgi:hypothetical protein